jgi:methylated-DNA-[protein]-cysteine S-methyltransferase
MAAIFHGSALARLTFGHKSRAAALESVGAKKVSPQRSLDPVHQKVVERLQAFAAGHDDDLTDLDVDYGQVTPFQRRVLDACRGVGPGETLSYGQLAQLAGSPGAARAVGSVMSHNKLPLVVPCHRIVGSGGSLGGYSAPEGLAMKRRLLEHEGARCLLRR